MTPQEKAANVALLAERAMGWSDDGPYPHWVLGFVIRSAPQGATEWDPYTSIADAMEMLDRFGVWDLSSDDGELTCRLLVPGFDTRHHVAASTKEAICAACLEWAKAQPPAPEQVQGRVEGSK